MDIREASAIILAGGKSTRMGQDKATLRWGQSDILHFLVRALQCICQDMIVVSNRPRQLPGYVRVVADIIPDQGPLSGIHAGLCYANYPHAFVTACDMPFIVPEVVRLLMDKSRGWDAVVPVYGHKQQPLFASYGKNCIPVIEELLSKGERRVSSLLAKVRCLHLSEAEWLPMAPSGNLFCNLNTIEEYYRARNDEESRRHI